MINVYIISGFLGAGKTTVIKKLLDSNKLGKVMLLENEFGEIGIDANLFDEKLNIKEINSGCICCSLKGDLKNALEEIASYDIDTLIIEPSGVGKLSEIMSTIVNSDKLKLASHATMVDAKKAISYHKNFKEFFDDQVIAANAIILSRVDKCDDEKLQKVVDMLKDLNEDAKIVTTPYQELDTDYLIDILGENVCNCAECAGCIDEDELEELCHEHHYDHDHECCHEHDHDHEHHHHDDECSCGCHDHDHEHEHHHHHDDECSCGCHDHHHHHHHADEVFTSIGFETVKTYTKAEIEKILSSFGENIVRAKGFVKGEETWLYFDLAGEDIIITEGAPKYTGLVTVIGSKLDEEAIRGMFK